MLARGACSVCSSSWRSPSSGHSSLSIVSLLSSGRSCACISAASWRPVQWPLSTLTYFPELFVKSRAISLTPTLPPHISLSLPPCSSVPTLFVSSPLLLDLPSAPPCPPHCSSASPLPLHLLPYFSVSPHTPQSPPIPLGLPPVLQSHPWPSVFLSPLGLPRRSLVSPHLSLPLCLLVLPFPLNLPIVDTQCPQGLRIGNLRYRHLSIP